MGWEKVMVPGCGIGLPISERFLPDLAKLITKVLLSVLVFYMTYMGTTRDAFVAGMPVLAFSVAFS